MQMEKTKVLHIITRVVNGGADENTLFTINGLDKDKYQIDLLTGKETESEILKRISIENHINVYQVESLIREIDAVKDFKALMEIYKIIKDNNYQIVHTHIAKAGVLGRLAAKMAGVENIIHGVHGITFPDQIPVHKREFFKNIERFCGLFTDKFITVGEDMKQKYIKANVGKAEDYLTIRSGMELSDFIDASNNHQDKINNLKKDLGIAEDDLVVGMVSKLEPRKGYKYYIEVAEEIIGDHPEVKFLIVGNGSQFDQLKEKVKNLKLQNNIIFTGYRTDIADVFSIFDIKILTSLWEGLPRVLVQAAATAKPIVTFDVDGAWEIVDQGENGYIVPMKDTSAMVEKLKLLIEDEKLRKEMGKKSQKKVNDSWTVENMVEETDRLYQELISLK
jgi:glycosyltransferase involved in cell wall biosynthesis